MPVETGTKTGTSAGGSGKGTGGGGQNNGLTKGYVGAAGTNKGAWSGDGKNLGLKTGNTIYGNTAFGPAGGTAVGNATRDEQSLAAAGMGPTMGTYSNFRTPSGAAMYGASPVQNQSFRAMNANQANAMANAAYRDYRQGLASGRVGGLLSDEAVLAEPLPPMAMPPRIRPASIPAVDPVVLNKSMLPAFFGGRPRAPSAPGGMPVGYDALRAAVAPDFRRNMTRQAGNYNNPALGSAARGTLGNYAGGASLGPGMGSSFGPGTGNSLGPGTGNSWGW